MDAALARRLAALNNRFYAQQAASFSATRGSSWDGWERCAEAALEQGAVGAGSAARRAGRPVRVLDVACGNLRFERFLAGHLPEERFEVRAVDGCDALSAEATPLPDGTAVSYRHLDIIEALARGAGAAAFEGEGVFDIAACFGFMHHVPGRALRGELMRALVGSVRPGGLALVSFWRFLDDPRLAAKARRTSERACAELGIAGLERGDCILGWQDAPGAYRYCHHFDTEEIDELCARCGAPAAARFDADGRSGRLNGYAVLRRAER